MSFDLSSSSWSNFYFSVRIRVIFTFPFEFEVFVVELTHNPRSVSLRSQITKSNKAHSLTWTRTRLGYKLITIPEWNARTKKACLAAFLSPFQLTPQKKIRMFPEFTQKTSTFFVVLCVMCARGKRWFFSVLVTNVASATALLLVNASYSSRIEKSSPCVCFTQCLLEHFSLLRKMPELIRKRVNDALGCLCLVYGDWIEVRQ